MSGWTVLTASLAYLALLFFIASMGDRRGARTRGRPAVYVLGVAVYCTSWTFYGAVGQATSDGFDYLAIYIGPALVLALGWPLIARMVRIAKAENVATISDFLSTCYGKSRIVARLVTLVATFGVLPYFALQLKAIALSFDTLTGGGGAPGLGAGLTAAVAAAMAVFASLYGVRRASAADRRPGLLLAVAAESGVKLAAALLVGAVAAGTVFGGPGGFLEALKAEPALRRLLIFDPGRTEFWATCLLSGLAFLCLPRQFHVAIVENAHEREVKAAAWGFPLYLFLVSLFVMPMAAAGLRLFPNGGVEADAFMIAVPLALDLPWLAFAAFIGGLAAASSMIVVATLALGTMICNDLLIPALLGSPRARALWDRDPALVLVFLRRLAVVGLMALAFLFHLAIAPAFQLTEIGLISFMAVAQIAPALIGGVFWRRATAKGAAAGLAAGFAGWIWTVLVPVFATAGWLPPALLAEGPLGLLALRPGALGGVALDPVSHGLLWSLGPNLLLFGAVSLATRAPKRPWLEPAGAPEIAPSPGQSAPSSQMRELAARYVGRARADAAFDALQVATPPAVFDVGARRLAEEAEAARAAERLLAGAIGPASAHVVVAGLGADRGLSRRDARALIEEASRAILDRHERMRDTLETVPQGICAFDADFRAQLWNHRFVELVDLPPEMMRVGTSLDEIVRYNEGRGEYGRAGEFDTLLARRLDPARAGGLDVYERRRPDGTALEIAASPMPSGGFVAVYTDVTERHAAAAALREANESLERRIAERTREFSAAKAEAERANAGKTRFLAAAGHDLQQPLQAARLFLSALAERSADPAVGRIDAALHSVEHLLGELLEVSKLDAGATRAAPTVFPVEEVLGPLGDEFAVIASRHGLALRRVRCFAFVRSDPALLRRVLQNFLANAVRYTERGRVLLGCRRRKGALSIEVWDTGPGVPPDKREEIFEEFRRLGGGAAERGEGLGLGLSIVRRLATLMEHPVSVRSEPGRGSGFSILVPLTEAPAAPSSAAAASLGDFGGALVLVIENDAATRRAMVELLEGWSCLALGVEEVAEALGRLDGRQADAILTDFHLNGGRTGLDALAALAARLDPFPPAAVMTADRDPAIRAAVEAAGFRLIHKPLRPAALRALLTRLLAERRAA